jgi:membrane fusion protein
LLRQAADMRHELTQMDAEADLQRERLALAQAALDRMKSLQNENFVSEAQVKARTEDVLGIRAQLQSVQRQRAEHERQIGVLDAQRREIPLQLAARQGEIERDVAALSQASAENAARQGLVVRAPQDGMVTAVLVQPGHAVTPSAALASLLPTDATLQAQLFAPSSAVGFLRPDQPVQLRYQAFPFQKFGHAQGAVMQVSRTPLQGSELAGLPLPEALRALPTAEPLYRVTVRLDRQSMQTYGQAQPLVPGMQLDADVLLERRRLIEWLFEPLLGVAGRI